ncbi:retrotransposon protein, putative, ty1-copia subclass [Tanacetum coccineum]
MFQAKANKERLDVVKSLMAYKPKPGASICAFVLEMKGYFDRLESLNMVFDAELSINIILSSLPADYNQFVLSYQMNRKETSIMELYSLLQTAEQGIKKIDVPSTSAAPVLTVGHNAKKRKTSHSNWKGKAAKGKSDRGSKRKAKSEIAPTSDPKEAVCFYCNTKGHWKRRLPKISEGPQRRKGCGTHICTVLQGLKESRRLKHGELNLVMGNRKITPVTRIGKYELMLKSGVRIDLNNCCYSSEMTRNIISFHALFKDGYKFSFDNENGDILVYSNGCFMFKASPCKGIYETVECISHNGNVILNVGSSNELDKSNLWHSRLGHVSKRDREPTGQKDKVSQLTPPRTPQLNGVTERRNRTLLDMVRSMMSQATLPISFWGYALETAAHILNLVPTKKVSKTPFEIGVFLEREIISKKDSGSKIDLEEIQESADEEPIVNTDTQPEVVTPVEPDDISLPIRRTSGRVSKPPQFYYGFHIKEDKISDSTLSELDEPANYKEAMVILEAAKWKEAMKSEIQSMYDNQVWNLVDTTPGFKTAGCKWIFKKKTDMDGKVHTYKARLVVKGYTQTHMIDYEETFSPVAKIKSIRIMLAIAAFHDYEI